MLPAHAYSILLWVLMGVGGLLQLAFVPLLSYSMLATSLVPVSLQGSNRLGRTRPATARRGRASVFCDMVNAYRAQT